jgi:hypothetical protein
MEAPVTTTPALPTARLRAEHAVLQRAIADLARIASEVSDWSVPP